ncbi:hypothetical protein [Pseudoclavibacter sp. CFCC 14310]|nr:hypothetical protein [Pseudoclavibacter sp. CFCC 14310]
MVHAKRLPDSQGDAREEIGADGAPLGFAWWAAWFVGGSGAVG